MVLLLLLLLPILLLLSLLLCCCCCSGCFKVADRWNANLCPLLTFHKCFAAYPVICAAVLLLWYCCCCSLFSFFCCFVSHLLPLLGRGPFEKPTLATLTYKMSRTILPLISSPLTSLNRYPKKKTQKHHRISTRKRQREHKETFGARLLGPRLCVCAALAAVCAAFADPFGAFSQCCCCLMLCFCGCFRVRRQLNPTLAAFDLPKCQRQFYN